ncbi:MAG TPA: TonB family protein, partial [Cyclobacteriaceae bacterium]
VWIRMDDLKHDIEKYLRGELSSSEMHKLEKKALDDPFLADALEGASMLSTDEFSDDLASLRKKIQQRTEPEKKVISLWYWPARIAAGLLILVVSGYIIFTLTDQNTTTQQLALNKTESNAPTESPVASQPMDTVQPSTLSKAEPDVIEDRKMAYRSGPETEYKSSELLRSKEEEPATITSGDVVSPPVSVAEPSPVESVQEEAETVASVPEQKQIQQDSFYEKDEKADKKKLLIEKPTASVERLSERVASANRKTPLRILHGKVTDVEDGTAIPGVNVIVKGTNKATVTDAEGNYQLSLNDSTKDELLFSFVGMQNQEVLVPATDSVNVQLSPDYASLSEVVVVGYASQSEGVVKEGENTYQVAEPEGGRKAYKTYLVTSMKYPQMAIENKIEGKVTVQFVVDTSGSLGDFRVIKGIGFGCDQEVIRLIKEGPKWSATKRNDVPLKSKVKVRLKFKLPQ